MPYRSVQPLEPANGVSWPSARPAYTADEIGTMLMFWTPPATTRSTVTPGTSCGSPAASQHVRATSPARGPTVSTQPKITSST